MFPVCVAMAGIQKTCETETECRQFVDELVCWLCDAKRPPSTDIARLLKRMSSKDFSQDAKKKLLEELRDAVTDREYGGYSRRNLYMIIGVADIPETLPLLAQKAYKPADDPKEIVAKIHLSTWPSAWDALKARARMGVKEDIELCIRVVDATEDKRDLACYLARHLSYIRQPEIVEYFRPYLYSEEVVDYDARDVADSTYAGMAAGALSAMVEGFPVDTSGFSGKDEYIRRAREWMRDRTDFTFRR